MDAEEYIITGPIWTIQPRNPPPDAVGLICNQHDGKPYVMAFTDSDLASRYFQSDSKCKGCQFGVYDRKEDFLALLAYLDDAGAEYIGFDARPGGVPCKLLTIEQTHAALRWSMLSEGDNG